MQSPPTVANEEDFGDLGYTEENLFDEKEGEPLNKHVDMGSILEENEEEISDKDVADSSKHSPKAKTWIGDKLFGFTAINTGMRKNLDPTVREALVMGLNAQDAGRPWFI